MSDFNASHNRAVWFDIPVADLERAAAFYRSVLAIKVEVMQFGDTAFAVLDHDQGNGGCLVVAPDEITGKSGVLVYLNANGRLREATDLASQHGGSVVEPPRSIGPHGSRAVVLDSEGNRIALHSQGGV
ncbi:MAG TPA: VOC family protein [Dokdonella sp.]|uniref:VOC family protein n=1 Tax=Dokdonella sp. TaxID=2291710 RepID=UPI002B659932|nr:VOC family protein [Dokdonella sp.]HPG94258.1 VOC family protein [Dokdonella sp.]HPN80812.1 VOC family protein [Dokdonella sp.]